ncbi:MAG: DUF2304 domain-containing protein [Bacteroidetes bacterium]|nr:DUF2304 domain-containing protein [Bacteroidota bacterium]
MENISIRIQILSIAVAIIFMLIIFRLIAKGKLREEYSIVWILCTAVLLLFSIWRNGLDVMADLLGIVYAPSLIFLAALFAIVIFLVHLSVVNSKQHKQIKDLAQEMALLKEKLESKKDGSTSAP